MLIEKNVKIIATIGPASMSDKVIESLIIEGVDAIRFNFSHLDLKDFKSAFSKIRKISKEKGLAIPIIQDLQGPKIRLNKFKVEKSVFEGDKIAISFCKKPEDNPDEISIVYDGLAKQLKKGQRILIDDGSIELAVLSSKQKRVACLVKKGGIIKARKGVNLPDTRLNLSPLTEKDIEDLRFAAKHKFDYVALSFVRSAKDISELKRQMKILKFDADVISKIEKPEALNDIHNIIKESDVVLVARGDLGVELSPQKVPGTQKHIIELCKAYKTPVIVATQMLESMTERPTPTRAEVSDVYQAVNEGADLLMLSGETAVGKYPAYTVKMMKDIVIESESNIKNFSRARTRNTNTYKSIQVDEELAKISSDVSSQISASFICVFTFSGWTARLLSKTETMRPIIVFTPNETIRRRVSLYRGIKAFLMEKSITSLDELIDLTNKKLKKLELVKKADSVVIVAGHPLGKGCKTNLLKVHKIY